MIDPALRAVGIADAAPVLKLGGDLDRPAGAGIDPGGVVVLVGTAARTHPAGLDAGKERDRASAARVAPGARYGRGANRTCHHGKRDANDARRPADCSRYPNAHAVAMPIRRHRHTPGFLLQNTVLAGCPGALCGIGIHLLERFDEPPPALLSARGVNEA